MFRLRRTDDSKLTNWFFEVDRKLLSMTLVLIGLGIIFAVSAGSATAAILHKPWYFFVQKGLPFYLIGVASLVIFSMLNTKWVLRLATAIVVVGLLLLAVTVVSPHVVKGSKRFVSFFGFNIMPADIIKPGFIVLTAWFLAKMRAMFGNRMWTRDALRLRWLSWWTYLVVVGPMIGIIFKHPDVGSTLLYVGVISIMLVLAGLPWKMFFALIGVGIGLLTFAYYTMDHVHGRINALITGDGDNYQVTQSVQAIQHGGLLGRGDDAFIKRYLPDAHTDFIFAAISEDLGALIACGLLVLLVWMFKLLVSNAMQAHNRFAFYTVGGTAALFMIQICINLISTLHIFAPTGMTLPFISYGGSSLVGFCILFGMMLALVRMDKWGQQ